MAKKILLNIFLNVAIIVLILCIVWSIKNSFYLYAIAATPPFAMLIYLKFRLVKSVRDLTKKR
jgi:ABC-type bacteriocin/lantibiotic exporter with double-glycine peptidase domain